MRLRAEHIGSTWIIPHRHTTTTTATTRPHCKGQRGHQGWELNLIWKCFEVEVQQMATDLRKSPSPFKRFHLIFAPHTTWCLRWQQHSVTLKYPSNHWTDWHTAWHQHAPQRMNPTTLWIMCFWYLTADADSFPRNYIQVHWQLSYCSFNKHIWSILITSDTYFRDFRPDAATPLSARTALTLVDVILSSLWCSMCVLAKPQCVHVVDEGMWLYKAHLCLQYKHYRTVKYLI